jgi:hypothetical protein
MRLLSHAYATSRNELPVCYGINVSGMFTCDVWPAYINISTSSHQSSFQRILRAATLAGLASYAVLLEEREIQEKMPLFLDKEFNFILVLLYNDQNTWLAMIFFFGSEW